jgi:hypothetical protein
MSRAEPGRGQATQSRGQAIQIGDERSDERAERFIELSAFLTGYGRVELLGTGLTGLYLKTLDTVLPAGVVDELLEAGAGGRAEGEAILDDPKLGPVARNVILLWYCGTWTALSDAWHAAYGSSPFDISRVVSAEAYQGALQWTAAGAHPAGARQQGFGAWSLPPEEVRR